MNLKNPAILLEGDSEIMLAVSFLLGVPFDNVCLERLCVSRSRAGPSMASAIIAGLGFHCHWHADHDGLCVTRVSQASFAP